MVISIKGNSDRLQSSLDFYLKLSSFQGYKNLDDMRSKLFTGFMEEEMNRDTSILDTNGVSLKEDSSIELSDSKDEFEESFIMDFVNSIKNDYVEHGIYVEDFVGSEEEELVVETEEVNLKQQDTLEYVGSGIYVEDYKADEETIIEDNVDSISDSTEEDDFVEDLDDSIHEEDFIEEEVESVAESDLIEEKGIIEIEENSVEVEEISNDDSSLFYKKEKITENNKNDSIVKCANIRDFIKRYQNSDISFVLKYYSKKEIEKALLLGKIYKKNGKLTV